mgnify:CR=1 FL=1
MSIQAVILVSGFLVLSTILYSRCQGNKSADYTEIMKEISIGIFEKLFEFAQIARRSSDGSFSLEHDKTIHNALMNVQSEILLKHKISENQVKKNSPENSCVPEMWQMFLDGKFPQLPDSVLPCPEITDEELLAILDLVLSAKVEAENKEEKETELLCKIFDRKAVFSNLLAKRLNESKLFEKAVVQIIAKNHAILQSHM